MDLKRSLKIVVVSFILSLVRRKGLEHCSRSFPFVPQQTLFISYLIYKKSKTILISYLILLFDKISLTIP